MEAVASAALKANTPHQNLMTVYLIDAPTPNNADLFSYLRRSAAILVLTI